MAFAVSLRVLTAVRIRFRNAYPPFQTPADGLTWVQPRSDWRFRVPVQLRSQAVRLPDRQPRLARLRAYRWRLLRRWWRVDGVKMSAISQARAASAIPPGKRPSMAVPDIEAERPFITFPSESPRAPFRHPYHNYMPAARCRNDLSFEPFLAARAFLGLLCLAIVVHTPFSGIHRLYGISSMQQTWHLSLLILVPLTCPASRHRRLSAACGTLPPPGLRLQARS
jgi:hypothetical protein